jgi:8-oxo-dGTP diphosphatase
VATVLPYAHQHELAVETYSVLSEEEGERDAKGVARLIRKVLAAALDSGQPTAMCIHRPVLPHILDALDVSPTTLVSGEFLVAHVAADGTVHALERHRSQV